MRTLLLIFLLLNAVNSKSQTATVNGVITYFFNKYQGNKPDIGAKVYLLDKNQASFLNVKTIDSFINGNFYMKLYSDYLERSETYETLAKKNEGKKRFKEEYEEMKKKYDDNKKYVDEYYEKIKLYGVETKEKFNALDNRVLEMVRNINDENSNSRTVDGNGNYSFTTKPGTYFIYIVSKNRNGINLTEILGKIFCKEITLKENDVKDVSNNFDLY